MRRSFLFLQGPCTPFFTRLADRLRADGHRVLRVNFCAGDALYWQLGDACNFRGSLDDLQGFLDEIYHQHSITDQILFGDRRPVHRPAIEHGKVCGVRTHVFEEGYFRPWWVTLERDGVNSHSLLPRDPDWFWEVGARVPDLPPPAAFVSPFYKRALHDVLYHLAGALNPVLFPRYRTHAGVTAPLEYAGYLRRFAKLHLIRPREQRRALEIAASEVPYFVLPLQLNTDAQIRDHSRFAHMGEVIEYVLQSFARYAPTKSRLVIKNHPLDPGLMNYAKLIQRYEREFDLDGRIAYLEDGDLNTLVRRAQGVVTVNSTVGIVALEHEKPTITLSDPIYNLPGLTCQSSLDDFWVSATPPDAELYARFKQVVMAGTQVNGGFYCAQGISLAVEHSARIVMAKRSPLEALL